jgi:RNA methyltransferase, TrmH family
MLSKAKIKLIRSLRLKKFRDELQLFTAEGIKLAEDLMPGFVCEMLVVTSKWAEQAKTFRTQELIVVSETEFAAVSQQQAPQGVMAVFRMKDAVSPGDISQQLSLALDDIQDPGNLGTIIRVADWFGIRHIFCSLQTADVYNPKVVQSCMGALSRVNLHYVDLPLFLASQEGLPVYGTSLEGENIYQSNLSQHGIIVMGNEGNGISPETAKQVTSLLLIPCFPGDEPTSESLNVAVATAVVCAEFRRRAF